MLWYVGLSCVILCYDMQRDAVLCYVVCSVMLCYAMLCYVTSCVVLRCVVMSRVILIVLISISIFIIVVMIILENIVNIGSPIHVLLIILIPIICRPLQSVERVRYRVPVSFLPFGIFQPDQSQKTHASTLLPTQSPAQASKPRGFDPCSPQALRIAMFQEVSSVHEAFWPVPPKPRGFDPCSPQASRIAMFQECPKLVS